jgi:tetratricopeptide (TPR) repeat protein
LRSFIPKSHRKGLSLYKENRFLEGIDSFQKSYDFFCQHNYLDKYRYLLLLSSSKMGYKEMALNNIAFGYSQIGDGKKAKEYYERLLLEFPKNGIAKAALKMIDSFERSE